MKRNPKWGEKMKLRKIEKRDNQVVGEIVQTSLKVHGLDLPKTAYYDPYLFELYDYYQQEAAEYWVVEEKGRVVGGAGIGPFDIDLGICELQKLYLLKEAQGKGYSKLLIEKALEFAKEHYDNCYIETFASLKVANLLYIKYGFKPLEKPLDKTEHGACDTWFLKKF